MRKFVVIFAVLGLLVASSPGLSWDQDRGEVKKAIIKVNYIRVHAAADILQSYSSPYGKIQVLRERNTLIIEDKPGFVDKLLSILKEIDAKPLDLQFEVELVLGTKTPDAKGVLSDNLRSDPVIKELRNLLKYDSFKLLDSSLIKVQDNGRSSQRLGGDEISLQLRLEPRHIKEGKKDAFQVDLDLRQYMGFNKEGGAITTTLIDTSLAFQTGKRTVVGVSKLNGGDQALILILQGIVIE